MTRGFLFMAGVLFGAGSFLGGLMMGSSGAGAAAQEPALQSVIRAELRRHVEQLAADREAQARHTRQLAADLAALREQVTAGFVVHRTIEVTEPRTAFPLIEPKLMLSVDALPGGSVIVNYAEHTQSLRVAQTVEFIHGTCRCYLLLAESERNRAVFHFGCEEAEGPAEL